MDLQESYRGMLEAFNAVYETPQSEVISEEVQSTPEVVSEEDKKWMQKAVKRPGAFTAKAEKAGMSVQAYANHVMDNEDKFDTRTIRQANLARTFNKEAKSKEKKKVEEAYAGGIDFKAAKRIDAAREKAQAEKDKKNPSGKDRRLMLRKFRPGASQAERAEGGRDSMREKGTSPMKDGKKMFETFDIVLEHLLDEGFASSQESAIAIMSHMSEEWLSDIIEAYEPMTREREMRVDMAKKKAYNKDMMAQRKGDTKEADKQFKRRMAMDSMSKMRK